MVSALAASLLVFPFLVSGQRQQQQQQHPYRKSPHEQAGLSNQNTKTAGHSGVPDRVHLDTQKYKNVKDTLSSNQDRASAVASNPLALAGDDRAVRAVQPVRGSGRDAGLSTPLHARSLQDWEVEDFVLLATVDGSIHARDRKTGAPRWELEVDRPMVETIYHTQNKSELDGERPEHDFLWIVEPSQDGDIYIYNQGGIGGLQKLHLTIKQLVADMSPYESADPAVVYNGEKRTKLYTVDATTGIISKVFGAGGALSKEPRCPRPGGLDVLDDEECGTGGTFVLGRTEYTISIQNRDTTEPICTIRYSEWGPNTRDGDLHSQYSTTMDNRYVYPLHDGSIFGWDYAQMVDRQRSYTQKLSSPVVRVFDVARPLNSDEKDPQLVILPQPVGPVDNQNIYDTLGAKNRIFVNHTEAGGWFAMSETTYPLVTGKAKAALCYDNDWLAMTTSRPFLTLAQRQEGFVGVHSLSDLEPQQASGLRTISAPLDSDPNEKARIEISQDAQYAPALTLGRSRIITGAADYAWDILIVAILLLLSYVFQQRRPISKFLKKSLEIQNPLVLADQSTASVPSSPHVAQPPWAKETDLTNGITARVDEDGTPLTLTKVKSNTSTKSRSNTLQDASTRSRSSSLEDQSQPDLERSVRFQEPGQDQADRDGDGDVDNLSQPIKKKARRGARGGAKHKKKKLNGIDQDNKDEVGQIVKDIVQDTKEVQPDSKTPIALPGSSDVTDVSGPIIQIGHLKVNMETVLGYGGHGTMVYQGAFGGRDVAVKRMLREFYDIASHEVGLLQESDDHPNVIRYYDKEEDSQFFYIALELCPASLQDVVEKPNAYPTLVTASLDKPEMLKQITAGVLHLHSLKIVHRDIKPQNILVSSPKVNPLFPTEQQRPRLLISDFGLCKKLEADQNSFRATTAHAAGTSGWRAPELLVDDDPNLKPSISVQDTNNSEPLVVDSQTKRSATRAIDIFSLGCIFYYCLTGGSHPFDKDGKFMREANIVKGVYDISALECLGDYQWEAKDLVSSMLKHNPKERPDAATILTHPFFWPAEKRLDFLCQVSDGFEHEKYLLDTLAASSAQAMTEDTSYSPALDHLESLASDIIPPHAHNDFLKILPYDFRDTLGKQRKYKGGSVLDLLRALRNKKNHYEDIPEEVKKKLGGLPAGYLGFWSRRFPNLLLETWKCVEDLGWEQKDRFQRFYRV